MVFETNKDKGRAGMAMAIAYFGANGYTVSIPLNDTQDYDLIVDKDGVLQRVQVKATGQKKDNGNYCCSLKSVSGTSRQVIGTVKDSSADLLFCLCEDSTMFLIPVNQISAVSTLTLQKARSNLANKITMDTSQYIVSF